MARPPPEQGPTTPRSCVRAGAGSRTLMKGPGQPVRRTMRRRTRQRDAIRTAIATAQGALSPREILERAGAQVHGLGIATVYRTVRSLLEDHVIQAVDLPGESSRYELADKGHHHHFLCRRCDRLFEIDQCVGTLEELAPRDFEVDAHDLVLYGVCAECVQGRR